MKYGLVGAMVPLLLDGILYPYTEKTFPELDMNSFKKRHRAEYKRMVARTPGVGSVMDNIFAMNMYIACYGFAYYKTEPDLITGDVFDGLIQAICYSDKMVKAYKGKDAFDRREIVKYEKGAARSQRGKYPMDWRFTFRWNPTVPEYYITHTECGVCKLAAQEKVEFLVPHVCVMDYTMFELKGAKLIRTKTIGNGDECCNFHIVKQEARK